MLFEVKETAHWVRAVSIPSPWYAVNPSFIVVCLTSVLRNILRIGTGLSTTVYKCHCRSRDGVYCIFS
jgi:hypothetical protein